MKTIYSKTCYKVTDQGRIRPTLAGWACLLAWAYFISRLVLILSHPGESTHHPNEIFSFLAGAVGAITLWKGTWLIYTLFSYNHTLRKYFRSVSTQFWMGQVTSKTIPPPPVKKVLYNYSLWTTTITYPDHRKFKATFHLSSDAGNLFFKPPFAIIPLCI